MDTVSTIVLLISLAGCIVNLRTRHIPNVLTFGSAAAALIFYGVTGGVHGLLAAGGGMLIATLIFFGPFALGGLGAGDVKLLAALGAWLGPMTALWLAAYTAMAGGVLALVVAVGHGYLRQALTNIWLLLTHWRAAGLRPHPDVSLASSTSPRLAYGVAIFFGTVGAIWLR
jgi:prepilin peptidase CpaA